MFTALGGDQGLDAARIGGVLGQLGTFYLHALQEADNVTLACEDKRTASELMCEMRATASRR
jgi:hypothetical protein